jgi:predicted nucleotidyltransferase
MRTTGAGESALLLLDVVELLREEGVDYAVIGALAASVHGAVRASMDADIVLSAGLATARNLERRFELAGFTTALTQGAFDDPIPGLLRVNDSHDNRVDLLIGLRGLEKDAFSRAIDVPFQGVTLKFIGREDFIAMKAFAGGPTDLQDAARAISADRGSLDLALLRRLAHKFGRDAADALERLLAK